MFDFLGLPDYSATSAEEESVDLADLTDTSVTDLIEAGLKDLEEDDGLKDEDGAEDGAKDGQHETESR